MVLIQDEISEALKVLETQWVINSWRYNRGLHKIKNKLLGCIKLELTLTSYPAAKSTKITTSKSLEMITHRFKWTTKADLCKMSWVSTTLKHQDRSKIKGQLRQCTIQESSTSCQTLAQGRITRTPRTRAVSQANSLVKRRTSLEVTSPTLSSWAAKILLFNSLSRSLVYKCTHR